MQPSPNGSMTLAERGFWWIAALVASIVLSAGGGVTTTLVSHGQRLSVQEEKSSGTEKQLKRMEDKIDRLLSR